VDTLVYDDQFESYCSRAMLECCQVSRRDYAGLCLYALLLLGFVYYFVWLLVTDLISFVLVQDFVLSCSCD
jgi:hypothetical protein